MNHTPPTGFVYLLSTQAALITALRPLLAAHALQLDACETVEQLIERTTVVAPEVIVLDLALIAATDHLKSVCERILTTTRRRPSLIGLAATAERGEKLLSNRLAARRAGLVSYLSQPVSARRLAQRVLALCGVLEITHYNVLVLVEDPSAGRQLAHLLASVGLKILVVYDPMKLLVRLTAFKPNLLLLDTQFTQVSGFELVAILRDDPEFAALPILFLSDAIEPLQQLWALRTGGDGFVPKSAGREALLAAIEPRLRRSRWFQDRLHLAHRRDNAHGFLPRDVFISYLERLLLQWPAESDKLGLILLDLDASAAHRERLGDGGLEVLLRELEQNIGQHLNINEAATRLGDTRYAVLARRSNPEALQLLANQLHEHLHIVTVPQTAQTAPAASVTLSIGVTRCDPPPEDLPSLLSRAEQAVHSASKAGGDRVHSWSPLIEPGAAVISEAVTKRLIQTALQQDGLRAVFQPILPVDSQGEGCYEAQIRLRTADGEELSPSHFLTVASRAALISPLDRWMLERTWQAMLEQEAAEIAAPRLLVHQHLATLTAPDWFEWLNRHAALVSAFATRTVLQLPSIELQRHHAEARPLVQRLTTLGFRICAANVSGQADEAHQLAALGIRLAKLTLRLGQASDPSVLGQAIQTLREQGIASIVPGVDGPDDLHRVWICRPDWIQGHYLQWPSPDLNFDFKTVMYESH
ncbi:diguanylate cyclase (GGDEF) domain-containing protein [Allochromatium warmingii]|uniref:Diguanylate cyclase (GGDEF) domain-containing protein n=1 Tax=Allochromatium warmingii TaxID=61595 RepID=A0A1H3EP00_ALLWA|nr:EAL domain-containing protein [Allochromatium warmingii]SDX80350.1 diguanylate cyclase (GGDEF) domain-containing protein [Allochromatium warmingii]